MSAIERYLLIAVFFALSLFAAYQYGKISAVNEIKIEALKVENKDIKKASENKDQLTESFNKLELDKDEKLRKMSADYRNLYAKYNSLRVGKVCTNDAGSAAAAAGSAEGNEAGSNGQAAGGIDIGDVAQEIIRLGEDLDIADAENQSLKNIAKALHQNCRIGAD